MKTTKPADVVRLVHDRRRELGLTQQQVAERAGVTRQLVARIETGIGDPSLGALFAVLAALRIELHAEATHPRTVETAPVSARAPLGVSGVPSLDLSRLTNQIDGWRRAPERTGGPGNTNG